MKEFLEWVTNKVTKQIRSIPSNTEPTFYDVYVQTNANTTTPPSLNDTPEGKAERLKAFVNPVEADANTGFPAGRHVQCYVKSPYSQNTNSVTKKVKRTSEQNVSVVYNVFDSGQTRGSFKDIVGEIEKGNLVPISDGLYELTEYGEKGKCIYPSWPEFYIYDRKTGEIATRRTKNYKGELSTAEKATATSRPLFLRATELTGIETRIYNEARRMHFVNQAKPATVDESESVAADEANVKTAKIGEEATAQAAAAHQ